MNVLDAEAQRLSVGVHEGKTLGEIVAKHRDYFVWLFTDAQFVRAFPELAAAVAIVAKTNGITKPERIDPNQQQLFPA